MEKQRVFDFIIEDNLLNGHTCVNCKNQKKCVDGGETISDKHTCGDWEWNSNRAQEQDEEEFMRDFVNLMDKYSISEEDRKAIYISANHF